VVKDVTVTGGNYGFHWAYGSNATLENVKMTNVANGLYIQNYASKTITIKNSNISSIAIWEKATSVQTFNFEGSNTVGALSNSQYAKYVLTATDATLTAPEGANVTTTVEGQEVFYKNGAYYVAAPVAQIGDVKYETLAEAIAAAKAGNTIVLLGDVTEDVTIKKNLTIDGAKFKYTGNISVTGKNIEVTIKNVNFVNGTGYAITTNTIKSITVENCTVTNYAFGFLYANKSTTTVTVKNVEV
jgi:hypothetical protein